MSGRASTTTTSITYGPKTSSSSLDSMSSGGSASMGYESGSSYTRKAFRVPVTESEAKYGSNDRVYSVTRNGVSVINHKKRISDEMEPRSGDATQSNYSRSSSQQAR